MIFLIYRATAGRTAAAGHPPAPAASMEESKLEDIRQQVAAPGMGLMIAGFLGLLPSVLVLLAAAGLFLTKLTTSMVSIHSPDYSGLQIGPLLAQEIAQPQANLPMWFIILPLVIAILHVPNSLLMILGGRKMRRLETYGLAVTAGICALLPTGPAWIISMPVGIWALIVLVGPDVRAGFRARRGG